MDQTRTRQQAQALGQRTGQTAAQPSASGTHGSGLTNLERVDAALLLLCKARDLLRDAGAVRTLIRCRITISSAKGARRHAAHEPYRVERGARKHSR